MTKKLCIFDLDGTLIDSLYDLADAMNYALEKNGMPVHDREKYRFMVGSGISVLADRAMVVPEGTDSQLKKAILDDFNSHYNVHNTDLTAPYEGVNEMLDCLDRMGTAYCVLSNKPDEFTVSIVKQLFPGRVFACVMGKREEYPRKLDPVSVNAILSQLSIEPEQALYIGDSNIDMQTAANAGIESIGVSWGFRPVAELEASGAAHIADKPEDILKYL